MDERLWGLREPKKWEESCDKISKVTCKTGHIERGQKYPLQKFHNFFFQILGEFELFPHQLNFQPKIMMKLREA